MKGLISQILEVNAAKRITAAKILEHPWLKEPTKESPVAEDVKDKPSEEVTNTINEKDNES